MEINDWSAYKLCRYMIKLTKYYMKNKGEVLYVRGNLEFFTLTGEKKPPKFKGFGSNPPKHDKGDE